MITETTDKSALCTAIGEAAAELIALSSALNEHTINAVPYENSWTAAQLLCHVTKSVNGMAQAMYMDGKPAERNPAEKIPQLKKTFLDFSIKMQSPEFIVPEDGPYKKQAVIHGLNGSVQQFKEATNKSDLNDLVEGLPLGPVTKLEILHFVLYHTQRHLQQMNRICDALKVEA